MTTVWHFNMSEDEKAAADMADDARAENARHLESLAWKQIQSGALCRGEDGSPLSRTVARRYVNDFGDVLSQSDDALERLITNVAGMRKGDDLRNFYAEAIALDVAALVSKAVADVAFAAALEAS